MKKKKAKKENSKKEKLKKALVEAKEIEETGEEQAQKWGWEWEQAIDNRIRGIEVRQNETQGAISKMNSNSEIAYFAYMVALVVFAIAVIVKMHAYDKNLDNVVPTIVDRNRQISSDGLDFAIVVDGNQATMLPRVDLEKMLKEANGKRKYNINYVCSGVDDHSVTVYFQENRLNRAGGIWIRRYPHEGTVANVSVNVREGKNDKTVYLENERFSYSTSEYAGSEDWLGDPPEPDLEDLIVLKASDCAFLISQEEYQEIVEAIELLSY